jgi:CheY-like chemotaxis protein
MSLSENSSLTLLVVEDDPYSRNLLCDMLPMLGHTVHCVETAEEAAEALGKQEYDILLADINLPGMSGIELASIALKTVPAIRIIFASGYGYLVADKTDFVFTLLPKPYGLTQLEHALNEACSLPPPLQDK